MLTRLMVLSVVLLFLSACGSPGGDGGSGSSGTSKLFGSIGSESAVCTTTAGGTTITLTSSATYEFYVVNSSTGLSTTSSAPIRKAEVQVLNSSGTAVACSTTDDSGNISMSIPLLAGSYTLKVLSRAANSSFTASVLNNPTSMTPYSISTSFSVALTDVSKSVTLSNASYTGTLEGGAFNILDQIYSANAFIKNQVNTSCTPPLCSTFTSAGKVQVFWQAGLSPAAYFGSPSKATSFFLDADDSSLGMASGIYMLGGIQGSTCADTDHFDNAVIMHEYGHFLEKNQSKSDSPGGSHDGNSIIDPRLAWSEGWANFLQGAIRNSTNYTDTVGHVGCSGGTSVGVSLDLENNNAGRDNVGVGSATGEGVFREVSVSRTLWDTMNGAGTDGYGANLGFKYIWNVFSDSTSGFPASANHFRNSGLFNELMTSVVATNASGQSASLSSLLSNEYQLANRQQYANPTTISGGATGGSCVVTLNGAATDSYAKTNDFYQYYYDGTANHAQVVLHWTRTVGSSSDIDLYSYKEGYSFNTSNFATSTGIISYSNSNSTVSPGTETITFSGKAAGYYLIHVSAYNKGVTSTNTYYLDTNSGTERLCPTF